MSDKSCGWIVRVSTPSMRTISEPDDRNVLIRDVQTISRLYPTEYAAVLGAIPTEATVVE